MMQGKRTQREGERCLVGKGVKESMEDSSKLTITIV